MRHWILLTAIAALPLAASAAETVINLDELTVGSSGYVKTQSFTSHGVQFVNQYDSSQSAWNGFALSNVNDTTTAGFVNQFASITGTGFGGSGNYAVGYYMDAYSNVYASAPSVAAKVSLPVPTSVGGLYVSNTTYGYLAMRDGLTGWGISPFNSSSWLKLTVTGQNPLGQSVGSIDVSLATGTNPLSTWQWVDLSSLGSEVKTLAFSMSSSDSGIWGMNTPSYFAIDNLTVAAVPEPTLMAAFSLAGLLLCRRNSRRA